MKTRQSLILTSLSCALIASSATAVDNLWNGSADSNWNNPANWSLNRVPANPNGATSGDTFDDAIIDTLNNYPKVSSNPSSFPRDLVVGNTNNTLARISQSAGTVAGGNSAWLFVGRNGSNGTYDLADITTSGGLTTGYGTGSGNLTSTGRLYVGGNQDDAKNGVGVLNINTSGVVSVSADLTVGNGSGSSNGNVRANGTINFDNGTLNGNNWIVIGRAGGIGTLNMSGGNLNKTGGNHLIIGDNGTGTINQTNGTITLSSGELWIGNSANSLSTYNISGGNFSVNNWFAVGRNNGKGTLTISGTANVTKTGTGNSFVTATGASSTATVTINGGSLTNTTSATWLGEDAFGGAGTTVWTQNGGTTTFGLLRFGHDPEGTATANTTFHLNGGTLAVTKIDSTTTGTNRILHFNGGTLKSRASDTAFLQGLSRANVRNGGIVIDTNGFNIGIAQSLEHSNIVDDQPTDGGLTKSGLGTITLSGNNTYTGPTLIQGGGIVATRPESLPGYNQPNQITVAPSASLGIRFDDVEWTSTEVADLLANVTFQPGSMLGIDTTSGDQTLLSDVSTISGLGLHKLGTNRLVVGAGTNDYAGPTKVSQGILDVGAGSLNTDSLILDGGTIESASPAVISLSSTGHAVDVTGNYTFDTPAVSSNLTLQWTSTSGGLIRKTLNAGNPVINANLDLGGITRTFAIADTGNDFFPELTVNGVISNGGVIVDHTAANTSNEEWGSILFSAENTYEGPTTIAMGRLEITHSSGLGSPTSGTHIGNRGTLAFGGSGQTIATGIVLSEPLTIERTVTGTYGLAAIQQNSGDNEINGPITLQANTHLAINGGSLHISGNIDETAPSQLHRDNGNNQLLRLSGNNTFTGDVFINSGGIVAASDNALGSGPKTIHLTNGDAGNAHLRIDGSVNPVHLPDTYTYRASNSRGSFINVAGENSIDGTIQNVVGGGSVAFISETGVLDVRADVTASDTNRSVILGGAGNGTISGQISNGATTDLPLTKSGTGTWSITSPQAYTGLTTISEGTLRLTTANALNPSSAITIASNGVLNLDFTGTQKVSALTIGETVLPPDTYNATTHPEIITGDGSIEVGVTLTPFQTYMNLFTSLSPEEKLGEADPDQDGIINLLEFAFKGDPTNRSQRGLVHHATVDANGNSTRELTITVAVRTGANFQGSPLTSQAVDGIVYTITGSTNLENFNAAVTEVTPALTPAVTGLPDLSGSGWEYRTFLLNGSEGLPQKGFLRAEAVAAP